MKPLKVRRSLETIEIIGAAMGLGFVSGLRLYATVLVLGLLILSGAAPDWMTTGEAAALSNPWVLLAAGAAALAEFIADKVPWFDTVWDSFHSVIRPIGASILAAETFGSLDPVLKLFTVLLCGGMAITSHGSKAASRLIVNHSPEPFSNIVLSLFEDVLVPGGVWLLLKYPLISLGFSLVFLVLFVWATPVVFRLVRLQAVALWAWLGSSGRNRVHQPDPGFAPGLAPDVAGALRVIGLHASRLPESHAGKVSDVAGPSGPASGIRAAATKSIKGMTNSTGYLVVASGELIFVTRRLFRGLVHRIPLSEIQSVEWKGGILTNRLILFTQAGERSFLIFRDVDIRAAARPLSAPAIGPPASEYSRRVEAPSFQKTARTRPAGEGTIAICCTRGPVKGFSVPVSTGGILIGRDPRSAHLIVDVPEVSSCHARVSRDYSHTGVRIEDLNSKNGTYYDAGSGSWKPVRRKQFLAPGSRFRLSKHAVEFEVSAG